jgi:hypothetical protein
LKQKSSEFGRGLVLCLAKFSEHFTSRPFAEVIHDAHQWDESGRKENLENMDRTFRENIEMFKSVYMKTRGSFKLAMSEVIQTWANGATDHLYEIKVPPQWQTQLTDNEGVKIWQKVKELRDAGLMGHGFVQNKIYTYNDFHRLIEMTHEICLLIDKKIGIKDADPGEW